MWDQSSSLAPTLLVAMPQLLDPNFSRAVVLLCEHREEGAMGLVINRCMDTLASAIVPLDVEPEEDSGIKVWCGGPVDQVRGWLLTRDNLGDGIEVSGGLYLSASRELLYRVMKDSSLAARCRFLIGYAGWGPRQLDAELAASAWLTVPIDMALMFDTPGEAMWGVAIRQLGIDPNALALGPGVH